MYDLTTQNLIFDFGGVILDLHTDKTHQAFGTLAGVSAAAIKDKVLHATFFNEYEKGLLSDNEFRESVRKMLGVAATDGEIDEAWNAMLGAIPPARLQLLEKLRANHRVFLLSNTNNIHLQHFNGIVQRAGRKPTLGGYFDRAYYSHILKMRKPDLEIFQHVLHENELSPTHTLFLDDNVDNLRGAEQAGIKTIHVTHPDMILSIFP